MPGVLILEAIAQVSGILIYRESLNDRKRKNRLPHLVGVEKVRFKKSVFPGDTIILYSRLKRKMKEAYIFKGLAFVSNKIVCEAEIILI